MKILKLMFSKVLVVFLLLVFQFSLIVTTIYYLELFPIFQLISLIIALIVFFNIVNKKECPEFKIPWLVLLFILPLFTVILYILFANPKMSKKDAKRISYIQNQTNQFIQSSETYQLELFLKDNIGIENYLSTNSFSIGSLNNKTKYFSSGESFFEDLLNELKKSEKFIFLEYFIISPGKMWNSILEILTEKVSQGVEVRILYDDIGTVGLLKNSYYKQLRKQGINCYKFNSFVPIISGIHNNRDHRKIVIIDGKIGFTGGINIADEYINEIQKFGHWKDTAIKIEGSAVSNLTATFLQMYDMTSKTFSEYEKYFPKLTSFYGNDYVHFFGTGPKPFYKERIGENNYINMINNAKKYIYISTPYLILNYNLTTALRNAAFRGVEVVIITPHIPDKKIVFAITRSNYLNLMDAGVKIYEYTPGFIHAKMLLADDSIAFIGTINLDYRSLVHHYECGSVLYDCSAINDIKKDFKNIISISEQITNENFKMGRFARLCNALLNMFSPML